ncbi:AraC family transcriptional regulator [Marinobacter salinus]|uniref:AraC family transcriptional regulator n=1 Tax=Marinobacter salinus TaxID=1874317 RepID=UPI001D0D4B7C|nr:helix-turn-helix domain-containing protein [Marinobacter salinus]
MQSYLRLNHASSREWLSAVRLLLGCASIECHVAGNQARVGALSAIDVEGGRIACLYASQDMDISGCQAEGPVLVVPVEGHVEASWDDHSWWPVSPLLIMHAGNRPRLRLGEKSQVIILKPAPGVVPAPVGDEPNRLISEIRHLVDNYLFKAGFFFNDQHARALTTELFRSLGALLGNGGRRHIPECLKLDRRLLRVLDRFRQHPEWEFDLRGLAAHCGVSERNLYYLMKRETGMTPYRLFQRYRLIRVRWRLVDCTCDIPHISTYAADEGFSHLGRFAALYREHFGELPSETVQWRRNLCADAKSPQDRAAVSEVTK